MHKQYIHSAKGANRTCTMSILKCLVLASIQKVITSTMNGEKVSSTATSTMDESRGCICFCGADNASALLPIHFQSVHTALQSIRIGLH